MEQASSGGRPAMVSSKVDEVRSIHTKYTIPTLPDY